MLRVRRDARERRWAIQHTNLLRSVGGIAVVACVAVGIIACTPHTSAPPAPPSATRPTGDASPAGDIPDNQAYVTFTSTDHLFTVKVPEGWSRTDIRGGVQFTDKLNTIELTSEPTFTVPTADSVNAFELPTIASESPGFRPGDVSVVNRPAGQAVLITYGADSPANPVTGKAIPLAVERYEFYRSGMQVTVNLSGPVGADNVDPWRTVTDSFRWLP